MEKEVIIDASNTALGRLASYVAKQALLGKKIIVLNSEKAIITGRKKFTIENYQKKRKRGSSEKGPYYPKQPERIVKRAIRGMLPDFRRGRGREAFKRILCYKGVPEEYKDKKAIKFGEEKTVNYIRIEELSKKI